MIFINSKLNNITYIRSMKRSKYKVVFYNIKSIKSIKKTKFIRICTRTYLSTLKFAIITGLKYNALFKITKVSSNSKKNTKTN
jgi:hypothetical protein